MPSSTENLCHVYMPCTHQQAHLLEFLWDSATLQSLRQQDTCRQEAQHIHIYQVQYLCGTWQWQPEVGKIKTQVIYISDPEITACLEIFVVAAMRVFKSRVLAPSKPQNDVELIRATCIYWYICGRYTPIALAASQGKLYPSIAKHGGQHHLVM